MLNKNLKIFNDKVYNIIKSQGKLGVVQQTRASTDDLTPAYSKIRDKSPNVSFSSGVWELSGVYGTKELTVEDTYNNAKYYFTFMGDSVLITIDAFTISSYIVYSVDISNYIGDCTFQHMLGQSFTNNGVYQREVGNYTPATIKVDNTKLSISCNPQGSTVKINCSLLYKINNFETIKKNCANDNLTFEYLRTT